MVFRGGFDLGPLLAAISRFQNQSARAHDENVLSIEHVQTIKRIDQASWLSFPTEPAVRGVENHAICSDGPAVQFVAGEPNRANRVPLWQRVLPFPTTTGCLHTDDSANRKRDDRRQTKAPD